ncbi:MAG: tetratricopeptide repeat protein, partial [Candidatus Dormibacteraceae bacterium]
PKDAGAHQELGMVLRKRGDRAGAAKEYQEAQALNQALANRQAATLSTNTGAKELQEGQVDSAIARFRAALKLAPDFASAHYQLGLAFLKKGENGRAAAEFQKAHALDPNLSAPTQ